MKSKKRLTSQDKALKIIKGLKKKGYTLERIARSLGDPKNGYAGVSRFSVHRWLTGKFKISQGSAARVIAVHG